MRPRHPAIVLVTATCAFLTSAARPLSSQLPKDPCAEATQAQVSAALGMPVGPGRDINSLHSACQWPATSSPSISLTAQFTVADGYDRLKGRVLPGLEQSPVAGVGDDAFAQTIGAANGPKRTTLFTRKGKTMVTLRVYGVPDQAKQLAAETAVAQAIVSKIWRCPVLLSAQRHRLTPGAAHRAQPPAPHRAANRPTDSLHARRSCRPERNPATSAARVTLAPNSSDCRARSSRIKPQVVQRRHAGVLDEQPQQVALGRMADRRERRHVPVALRLGDDGVLHPVHGRRADGGDA